MYRIEINLSGKNLLTFDGSKEECLIWAKLALSVLNGLKKDDYFAQWAWGKKPEDQTYKTLSLLGSMDKPY